MNNDVFATSSLFSSRNMENKEETKFIIGMIMKNTFIKVILFINERLNFFI